MIDDRRREVVQQLKDIDLQLGDPNRTGPGGQRLSDNDYWTWRKKATAAKRMLEHELSTLNAERRAENGDRESVADRRYAEIMARLDRLVELAEFFVQERA
jgi:hypothetical protein